MIQKLKESKPVIGLVWLLVLLVAGYVIRTYLIGTNFIGNADDLLYIISDTSAFSMEDALPTLFWLPAVCYAIMYLLYVNAQHGVDPAAEMRKNGIALIMLLVLMAAELVLSYLVLTGSMRILTPDEMNYANIVKTTLLKAYGIATVVDIVLYLVPAFVGRPRR